MHIGRRIAKLRRIQGFSQQELGKGIISGSYLSNLEAGKSAPSGKILRSLAERLDVPEDYLLDWDKKGKQLENKLTEYRQSIISNLKLAKGNRTYLKEEYPLIYSIEQEVYFYLCECNFLLKTNELEKALNCYEKEVSPYFHRVNIDESLSDQIKEVYYNFQGLRCFYQLQYSQSLNFYRKQLSFIDQNFLKAAVLYSISLLSIKLDHTQKGIDYGLEALDIYLKENQWQ
ncbi:MAG TPA: helix-turn-helix transcriptional regulator, partial [Bacillales bacterium]